MTDRRTDCWFIENSGFKSKNIRPKITSSNCYTTHTKDPFMKGSKTHTIKNNTNSNHHSLVFKSTLVLRTTLSNKHASNDWTCNKEREINVFKQCRIFSLRGSKITESESKGWKQEWFDILGRTIDISTSFPKSNILISLLTILDHRGFMLAEPPTWCFPGITRYYLIIFPIIPNPPF